jgi:cell division septum initiation protein DivIVA
VARRVPVDMRNVAFPAAVRGYDRRAVDTYVTRANRVIAELEATRSPEAAVKRALERTEEQRSGILEQARATAQEMTAAAQQEAEEITAMARAEAAAIVVNADTEADRATSEADEHVAAARTAAEEILAKSRSEAADRLQRAEEEIEALREEAEARLRELRIDTMAVWADRRALVDDLRDVAARLQQAASLPTARAGSPDGSAV